jgi:hypothetical protein
VCNLLRYNKFKILKLSYGGDTMMKVRGLMVLTSHWEDVPEACSSIPN